MEKPTTLELVWNIIARVWFIAIVGYVLFRSLRRSASPRALVGKWIATVAIVWFMVWKLAPLVWEGALQAFVVMHLVALCALGVAAIWRHSIAAVISRPFGSLYDGGEEQMQAQPAYSIAQAKRNRGKYPEAVSVIRQQLEKFPHDLEGHLLLADIQAQNLNDLAGAEVTLRRYCRQPKLAPVAIAAALNALADLHLKHAQDPDAARAALESIIEILPDSEWETQAAQRIAHLADRKFLVETHEGRTIAIPPGSPDIGLRSGRAATAPAEPDPERLAEEYVSQLEKHPLDTEAREKLALIYADHYGRLDLAADQLEQLISAPNQPARRVVHWLNFLADLQVRHGAGYETVRQTLMRIIERFPGAAAAQTAQNRLDHLRLELKVQQKSQTVRLGSYEKDAGLKRGPPR